MATVSVPLTQGKHAIIDDCDADHVLVYRWYAQRIRHHWYAARVDRTSGTRHMIYLHRFILDAPPTLLVDHRDGDGLNCVRANLRYATKSQNNQNSMKRRTNSSGFIGVQHIRDQWRATIKIGERLHYLGLFPTAEEAARVYDQAAREHRGDFARLNFPD
jgi:hypothetical protein